MSIHSTLTPLVKSLLAGERIAVEDWPEGLGSPESWGLGVSRGQVSMLVPAEPLDEAAIRDGLGSGARQWLRSLEVHPVIGSTNNRLLEHVAGDGVHGLVCLAELQTAGRGRRGRDWVTPLGGGLALSAGFAVQRPLAELGGLSLAVGLAALDAMQDLGAQGLALKWPNDLLHGRGKLAGTLVELKNARSRQSTDVVVGIGINLRFPEGLRGAVDQQVADLHGAGLEVPRNRLVARLIDSLHVYVEAFDDVGFAPMRAQYDEHHGLHGVDCEVRQAGRAIAGRVEGVTDDGELRIATASGLQVLRAGEVSLRTLA